MHAFAPVETYYDKYDLMGQKIGTIKANITQYHGSSPFPVKVYETQSTGFVNFTPAQLLGRGTIKSNAYKPKMNYLFINGDLVQENKENDINTCYLYGYNKQYPIAKIIGSDFYTAYSYVSQVLVNDPMTDDQTMRSHLNALRSIPNTQVTTYTYRPLVGMTSETAPDGKTIFYEYDNFGQLKLVRNQDGNIVKTYQYNYRQ